MYKITKSETKKIGTIKLPKGVWLNHINSNIDIAVNADVAPYIDLQHVLNNILCILSNYKYSATKNSIRIYDNFKIDYNCTKSDCTNEWTFYEKVEDTVKVKPDTVECIWTDMAYKSVKGENTFTIHGCIDDSWLGK